MFIIPAWAVLNEIDWIAQANHISLICKIVVYDFRHQRRAYSFISAGEVWHGLAARAVEAGMAYQRFGKDEEPAPAQVPLCFDAGLECYMPLPRINTLE